MTEKHERNINWSLTTWKGSRLQQHREFHALPFSQKLELVEEMGEMADEFVRGSGAIGHPATLREDSKSDTSLGQASLKAPVKPHRRRNRKGQ